MVASAETPAEPAAEPSESEASGEGRLEYAMLDDDVDEGAGYLPDDYEALTGLLYDDGTEDADAES